MSEPLPSGPIEYLPPKRSLARKLAEVMGEVKRIAKNGKNDHFNYKFATEADIAEAVRDELAKRHIIMFPSVKKVEWEKVQRGTRETKLCTLTVEFSIEDGDSGEVRKMEIIGQGEDSMDKATYKAMTGAEKYALMKLFLIPTGDDPERDEKPETGRREAPRNETPRTTSGPTRTERVAVKLAERAAPANSDGLDVAPFKAFLDLAKELSISTAQLAQRGQQMLGKTNGFTPDDLAKLRSSFQAVPGK